MKTIIAIILFAVIIEIDTANNFVIAEDPTTEYAYYIPGTEGKHIDDIINTEVYDENR